MKSAMKKRTAGMLAASLLLAAPGAVGAAATGDAPAPPAADGHEGIALSVLYRADIVSNVSGGLKRGTSALGNLDVKLDFDLDALAGLDGTSVGLHGIASHGGKPNERYVGSSQGIDNIEVDTNTAKLLQAWIQRQWEDDRFSVRAGLYDLNSEFYVSHSTGIFMHPSPGIGSELAQTGVNGPSIFPTTSVALRALFRPTSETYLQAVVLDGVPGDPDNPRGTHVQFNEGDGTLRVAEAGVLPGRRGDGSDENAAATDKYAVGGWSYTARFDDLAAVDASGDPLRRKGNRGFYVLAERTLHRAGQHGDGHVDGFVRYGRANADFNQFSSFFQTGLVFSGMVAGRGEDQFALSWTTARTGQPYRLAAASAGQEATRDESVWELTYRAQLAPWLVVQPNLQYVTNPGADAQARDAVVLGLRLEMLFEK
jgi:porin